METTWMELASLALSLTTGPTLGHSYSCYDNKPKFVGNDLVCETSSHCAI